jgi:hypothetical protein
MPADPQTPLTAEQALTNAIWHAIESLPLGTVTDALPGIIAELRGYGYAISKVQPEWIWHRNNGEVWTTAAAQDTGEEEG